MTQTGFLSNISFHPIVPFEPGVDQLIPLDFTGANRDLTVEILENVPAFCRYVERTLTGGNALYGIGGYCENRTVYSRSRVFDDPKGGEPRRLHLGIDIWGKVGTPVSAPMDSTVHSLQNNSQFGDYGATIILQHDWKGQKFHTLYGHLQKADLSLKPGQKLNAGQIFGHFGPPEENGFWPPHLHFQIILDMEGKTGDYPGVCRFSEMEKYALNCPDPDLILNLNRFCK